MTSFTLLILFGFYFSGISNRITLETGHWRLEPSSTRFLVENKQKEKRGLSSLSVFFFFFFFVCLFVFFFFFFFFCLFVCFLFVCFVLFVCLFVFCFLLFFCCCCFFLFFFFVCFFWFVCFLFFFFVVVVVLCFLVCFFFFFFGGGGLCFFCLFFCFVLFLFFQHKHWQIQICSAIKWNIFLCKTDKFKVSWNIVQSEFSFLNKYSTWYTFCWFQSPPNLVNPMNISNLKKKTLRRQRLISCTTFILKKNLLKCIFKKFTRM